jgi:hypothetical protein
MLNLIAPYFHILYKAKALLLYGTAYTKLKVFTLETNRNCDF